MSKPILSKRKSDIIGNGVFLIGLGILFYINSWWPGILLPIWASLGSRQFLTGRIYDLVLTTVILWSLFIVYFFKIDLTSLLPVLFVLGGIYIVFREFFYADDTNGEDKAKEITDDIDDGKKA